MKPNRYLVRGANDPVGDEQEHKAWSAEEAACNYVAWMNNRAAEYDERTVIVTGPDGRTVVVVVTLDLTPRYTGKVTGELP